MKEKPIHIVYKKLRKRRNHGQITSSVLLQPENSCQKLIIFQQKPEEDQGRARGSPVVIYRVTSSGLGSLGAPSIQLAIIAFPLARARFTDEDAQRVLG